MKKVQFPLIKTPDTNLIEYPDDVNLFHNVNVVGNVVHADYSGIQELEISNIDLIKSEREWRDDELLRTDKLVILPDYPRGKTKQSFLDYRQALADYPQQPDFPNGLRPAL